MLQLNTATLNAFEKIKEKLKGAISLSPAEWALTQWLRRMQRREVRLDRYRSRNAAYPYQSKRQMARNLCKIEKAESRGFDYFGRRIVVAVASVCGDLKLSKTYSVKSNAARAAAKLGIARDDEQAHPQTIETMRLERVAK